MTKVSDLSREIAAEIKEITGRSISVDDYLKIREKAVIEIENGLYERELQVNLPKVEPIVTNVAEPSKPIEPKIIKPNPVPKPKSVNDEPDWKELDTTSEDPFFAMCNKL